MICRMPSALSALSLRRKKSAVSETVREAGETKWRLNRGRGAINRPGRGGCSLNGVKILSDGRGQLVDGSIVDQPAHAGLYSWRQMMAKNDEVRQNLIPLSKQYQTLAAAQADIANIPEGSTTYYRSPDDSALAIEVMNVGGTLTATGRKMPSQEYVESVDEYVTTRLFSDVRRGG